MDLNAEACQGMVRVPMTGSPLLWGIWLLGHGVGLCTWLCCQERLGWWMPVLLLLQGVGAWRTWKTRWDLRCPHVLVRLDMAHDGRLTIIRRSGARIQGRLCVQQVVTPWWVSVAWRDERGQRRPPLVLTRTGMTDEEWRKLRVMLRHPMLALD